MNSAETVRPHFAPLERLERQALIAGLAILTVCALGALANPQQFFRSYLLAYLFWIGLALGSTAVVMLHHLAGGSWGFVIRRLLESGSGTIPLMALLAVPLLLGLPYLYAWAQPAQVAADELLRHKSLYLNVPFFVVRLVFYFAVWMALAYLLNKWSLEQDRAGEAVWARRLRILSGPGLVLYGLTVTFASIDWVMSLEPHWFSTIYGPMFMVGQVLATLAFMIATARLLADQKPLSDVLSPSHFHDLGNLMLAFVMLWAYLSFSQFLIIWSGNLPEEIPWYLHRIASGWQRIALFLVLFHFAVPFLLLLSRGVKRKMRMLSVLAVAMIFMRLVDLYWFVEPAFDQTGPRFHWMDVLVPLGMGGVWVSVFAGRLKSKRLLPRYGLEEAPEHG